MPVLVVLLVLGAIFFWKVMASIVAVAIVFGIAYEIYLVKYFSSQKFKTIKSSIENYVKNCNDLNEHIADLKRAYVSLKSSDFGDGVLYDDSNYKIKRKEWGKSLKSNQVHNCSASVCKNASEQPFKYLCKYFGIKPNEESLAEFESVLNDFAAAEQGKVLLVNERDTLLKSISNEIPKIIQSFSEKRLVQELGFKYIDLGDLYFPVYSFQYVSAGGNSSVKFDIKLDVGNLDKFIGYLNELVKFRKSIAGQRALMTSSLREKIKQRDKCTCQMCGLSVADEKNLLLEIDHIIPLSKGGVTSEDNLQTLCWRCNRSKGAKIIQ